MADEQQTEKKEDRKRREAELTLKYLANLERDIKTMQSSLAKEQYKEIQSKAHRISNTATTHKLPEISEEASYLERCALCFEKASIEKSLDKITQLMKEHSQQLNSILMSLPV